MLRFLDQSRCSDHGKGDYVSAPAEPAAVLYCALYAGFGVQTPYFPLLLERRGLDAELIGLVLSAGTTARLVAGPVAGQIADRCGARRAVLALCAVTAAALTLTYLAVAGVWPLLAIAALQAAALAPLAPLADTLVLAAAAPKSGGRGFTYGSVRGVGSAAFILGTLLSGGAVSGYGIGAMVCLSASLLASTAIAAIYAPLLPPLETAPPTEVAPHRFGSLFRLASFRRLIIVAALILGSHAMHDSFAVIRWQSAGITTGVAGLLWSEQVAAEVLIFLVLGPWLLDRIGVARAAALAAVAGVLRWSVMGASAWLPAMILIEPLHGLTFALLHLACMRLLAEIVPPPLAATALTLYGTLGIGAATMIMTLASGPLYAHLGARGFWVMAALCVAALPLAFTLREPRFQK